jgi:hypothetical protein
MPKTKAGQARVERNYNLRLPPSVYELIRRHAFERNRSMNALIVDVLRLWVIAATDPTDPFFAPETLGVTPAEPPEEVYPGYTESLVFVLPRDDHAV